MKRIFVSFAQCLVCGLAFIAPVLSAEPITEIQMSRTLCFGYCPAYEVTMRRDGAASYSGKENVSRIGTFQGTIDPPSFDKLAQFLESQGLFNMERSYPKDGLLIYDASSTSVTIKKGNEQSIAFAVMETSSRGPNELHTIQKEIDRVAETIDWKMRSSK